ncbi:MFS transporter [Sphingomonas parva]|uniref:MFS transporter n=1 Tax=Sphingomonas parva TaxID=2555898 RepID=A0A4Y8ZYN7_9SPHN|nr:MFS transporter [Sphingomonas parva]TFI59746.1 MFS transporter [Sphingomonas parva]
MKGLGVRERLSALAVLTAMAAAVLDAGIVNVALPLLAARFDSSPADTILVVTAYQLALVMGLLPSAHLAERFGFRRLFVGGIVLFCGASLLCALAPSLPLLIAARFLQGLGGAAIMALGIALLRAALGTGRLGASISWNALTVALCSAAGPLIGGLILSVASWHWLFLASLPVGAVALLASRALPPVAPTKHSADPASIALYGLAVTLLVVVASSAATHLVASVAAGIAAGACFVLLARRGARQEAPLVPLDLLAVHRFRVSVAASICCFTAQSIGMVALPFYLQMQLTRGPLVTGLVLTTWPVSVAVTSTVATRLLRGLGNSVQCGIGGAILAGGLLLSAVLPTHGRVAHLVAGASICGIGFGLFQLANNRAMFFAAPPERSAAAGGLQSTARLTGQISGTLMMSAIFTASPSAAPTTIGLAAGAVFALAAALLNLWEAGTAGRSAPLREDTAAVPTASCR